MLNNFYTPVEGYGLSMKFIFALLPKMLSVLWLKLDC